ncbi:MAG: 2-C-methyl-D-erythritol 4-phosphate cytidylyltransferase [Candidatus Pacebacteria bacterium]|nr:2-C-methyl-D-erythritol 4-phosphate cytidylyltransferase [Candidatus Paceibacterota bacterium]
MTTSHKNISAILLAAGTGERMGKIFKQFTEAAGFPVLHYSLKSVRDSTQINRIVIVTHPDKFAKTHEIVSKYNMSTPVDIIEGGRTRRESALRGLEHLTGTDTDMVILHDVSRPLITKEMVLAVVEEVSTHKADGAVVGIPAIDLLFQTDPDGYISQAFDKNSFCYGHTPQCFPFEELLKAHHNVPKERLEDVDNVELMKRNRKDVKIRVLRDFHKNHKLTYPHDIDIIESLLKNSDDRGV